MSNSKRFQNIDSVLLFTIAILVIAGLINIYSSEYNEQNQKILDLTTSFGKQLVWVGVSFLLFFVILLIDARFYLNMAWIIYAGTLLLLVVTLVTGQEIAGSKSWLKIGFFNVQPSEFAKLATALALARYLDRETIDLTRFKHILVSAIIIGLPMFLIILQNDFGSALVFVSFALLLFRQGLNPAFLWIPIVAAILFVASMLVHIYIILIVIFALGILFILQTNEKVKASILVLIVLVISAGYMYSGDYVFHHFLQPHQQTRINVLLGKEKDLKGAGYNVHQALIAIGSGGFKGKGYLKGTQTKFNFIPEQSTDFIFCTVAEEWGLWGSTFLLLLFFILLYRILVIAEKQKFRFVRNYAYGVLSVLFFHITINLGMTMGLLPVIGIPLPFISYGGSSLIGFVSMLALLMKFDADFKYYYN